MKNELQAPASERGWIFGLLIAPYGVLLQGIVQGGVLGYLLSREGAGSATQAHLIGLLSLPTSLYFLWSLITDFLCVGALGFSAARSSPRCLSD